MTIKVGIISGFLIIVCLLMPEPSFSQSPIWNQTNGPNALKILTLSNTPSGKILAGALLHGIFISSNYGQSWMNINSNIPDDRVQAIGVAPNGAIFVGTNGLLSLSTDTGSTWTSILAANISTILVVSQDTIFAGTYNAGVFRSTNGGQSWIQKNTGLTDTTIISIACLGDDVFAGTDTGGIFRSTNSGGSWTRFGSGLPGNKIKVLRVTPIGFLLVGTQSSGIFRSTDKGKTWLQSNTGLDSLNVSDFTFESNINFFLVPDSIVFVAMYNSGIFMSDNGGTSWFPWSWGLTDRRLLSLASDTIGYIYAGTDSDGVFRTIYPTLSVHGASERVPSSFMLKQNYPNPFNPSTIISYRLPDNSFVTLKVFDVLGREVAMLVNERQTAGGHSVILNGAELASGVYFYRLQAGTSVETRKLTILK